MNIFGLEPYLGAIIIAAAGIAASTIFGWLQGSSAYDPRKAATSILIAIPASLIFVATELQVITIPEDGGLTALIVVAGLIGQVAGFDTLVKTAKAIITKKPEE